jgi:hypothetical protein
MAVTAVASFFQSKETARKSASMQEDAMQQAERDRAVKPPQAAQQPDQVAKRAASAAQRVGGGGGETGTMLTGSGGVTADLLNLGKNTLLGQ